MKQWIFICLIALAVLFILGVIFQILWIRRKLSDFSTSKLSSEMTQNAKIVASTSAARSNLIVYNVVLNSPLTQSLNTEFNSENIDLMNMVAPKTFNIPHTCGNIVKSMSLSCNDVAFLVLQKTLGSEALIQDIENQSIMYIMVNGNLYLIDSSPTSNKIIQDTYTQYNDSYIVYVYTISTAKNIVLNTGDSCELDVIPFYGSLSTSDILNDLDMSKPSVQIHMLGYYKSNL